MIRDLRILVCECLYRLADKMRPIDYELKDLRKQKSYAARSARNEALMRLRDPSGKMLAAAASAMSPGKRPTQDWVSVKEKHRIRYQAMIDAALSEKRAIQ